MKILFHINSLGLGGAERVVSILANAFCKMGYDVFGPYFSWNLAKKFEVSELI